MKISDTMRYSHPVLAQETGDYKGGEFSIALAVAEAPARGEVALAYTITLTEPHLTKLVSEGLAEVGIFVECRETYFTGLFPLGLAPQKFTFQPDTLLGRVTVRPIIWASKTVENFPLDGCHAEFGKGKTDFPPGAVLALGEEYSITVDREKLAQIETIFNITKAPSLPSGTLGLGLEKGDRIQILVAEDIYETVNRLRGIDHGRPVILNGVFLPAIMQLLESVKGEPMMYEGKRWHRVLQAKCDHLEINTDEPDLWKDAQKLLQAPFHSVSHNKQLAG